MIDQPGHIAVGQGGDGVPHRIGHTQLVIFDPAAVVAPAAVDHDFALGQGDRPGGTGGQTVAAAAAVGLQIAQLGGEALPLRVAAPLAAQGAALEKDGGANAPAVHKGAVDLIENEGGLAHGVTS